MQVQRNGSRVQQGTVSPIFLGPSSWALPSSCRAPMWNSMGNQNNTPAEERIAGLGPMPLFQHETGCCFQSWLKMSKSWCYQQRAGSRPCFPCSQQVRLWTEQHNIQWEKSLLSVFLCHESRRGRDTTPHTCPGASPIFPNLGANEYFRWPKGVLGWLPRLYFFHLVWHWPFFGLRKCRCVMLSASCHPTRPAEQGWSCVESGVGVFYDSKVITMWGADRKVAGTEPYWETARATHGILAPGRACPDLAHGSNAFPYLCKNVTNTSSWCSNDSPR